MESEKVKEIKKALEFQRDGLAYLDNNCIEIVYCKDILTLINELECENERLSSRYRNLEINYNDTWEHYREYEVENQQLKDRIAELEKETAEKVIKWFKENALDIPSDMYINEFAKQFGVEVDK